MKWNVFSYYMTTATIMIIQCKIHKLDKFKYSYMNKIYCGIICMECKLYSMQNLLNIDYRIYINWNVSKHLEINANMRTVKVREVKINLKRLYYVINSFI